MIDAVSKQDAEAHSTRLGTLLGNERDTQVAFLLELAAFETSRGYELLGYASLWDYCEHGLKLQGGPVFRRTTAARMLRDLPDAAAYLRDGRLSMTTLVELRHVITPENSIELLDAATWKSKDDVEYLVACRRTKAAQVAPSGIRKLPVRHLTPAPGLMFTSTADTSASASGEPAACEDALLPVLPISEPKPRVEAVCEDRFSLRLVFDEALKAKLTRARAALSHTIPSGDLRSVIERGLDLILEIEAKKHGPSTARKRAASTPKVPPPTWGREHLSAEVVRFVWQRDEGCCTWERAPGNRCRSTWKVEIDHINPVAKRGKNDAGNLRLLCRTHNQFHARREFGTAFMERVMRRVRASDQDHTKQGNGIDP